MLAYAFYDNDNRIRRYAETLVDRGDVVDAICLRHKHESSRSVVNGVRVWRIERRVRDEKTPLSYLFRTLRFWLYSFVAVSYNHLRARYDIIHVHSVPDFEVFATWLVKFLGAKVILDIHDIVPEFYASKFRVQPKNLMFKLLLKIERWSSSYADYVIASNEIWRRKLVSRSVAERKCLTVLNYPDFKLFYQRPRTRNNGKFIFLYPGGFQWHQGLDIAVKAFGLVKNELPNAELHLYGDGGEQKALQELVVRFGLEESVLFQGVVPTGSIPDIIANADVGIVPKRNSSFGGEAFSTKILEYMSQGLPCLVSATNIDKLYFDDTTCLFFDPGDVEDMARKMLILAKDPALRDSLSNNGKAYLAVNNWDNKKHEYLTLVDKLIGS